MKQTAKLGVSSFFLDVVETGPFFFLRLQIEFRLGLYNVLLSHTLGLKNFSSPDEDIFQMTTWSYDAMKIISC